MSAEFTSRLDEFRQRHAKAIDAALVGAANVLKTAVQRKHRRGYTSGRYSFGQIRNGITHSLPVTEDGVRVIRVGIRGGLKPKHPAAGDGAATLGQISMWWELGHNNAWTRKYERVEKWRPAAEESRNDLVAKFSAIYQAMMARGAA